MGFEFGIKGNELKNVTDKIDMIADSINACYKQVMNAVENLAAIGLGELKSHVGALLEKVHKNAMVVKNLHDSLNRIVMVYVMTEMKIALNNVTGDSVGEFIGGAIGDAVGSSVFPGKARDIINRYRELIALLIDVSDFEYTYVPGGTFAVPIRPEYLNTEVCLKMAQRIIDKQGENGLINGMDAERVAAEIFCHAVGYYMLLAVHAGVEFEELLSEMSIDFYVNIKNPIAIVCMTELLELEKIDEYIGPEEGLMEHAQTAHIDQDGNPYMEYWRAFRALGM